MKTQIKLTKKDSILNSLKKSQIAAAKLRDDIRNQIGELEELSEYLDCVDHNLEMAIHCIQDADDVLSQTV